MVIPPAAADDGIADELPDALDPPEEDIVEAGTVIGSAASAGEQRSERASSKAAKVARPLNR